MATIELANATVGDAMLMTPTLFDADAVMGDVRDFFRDDHVHAALIVRAGVLLSVIERADLPEGLGDDAPALAVGQLSERIVTTSTPLEATQQRMLRIGRRRLAVVDGAGGLLGLLCLNRKGTGFCSDEDVAARRADPHLKRD